MLGNEPITEAELEGYRTYAEVLVPEEEKRQEALEQDSMRIEFRLGRRDRPR